MWRIFDFSGDREEVRGFFSKFGHLPKAILTCVCYSLSKRLYYVRSTCRCYDWYSDDEEIADEFLEINKKY